MKTIAIDIDDVLAANAEAFINFSNERWGTNLTVDDWTERWSELWKVDSREVQKRAKILHTSGVVSRYKHAQEAEAILKNLKKNYRLIIITSRRIQIQKETIAWVKKHYAGTFDDIIFAGFYDTKGVDPHSQTKAELAKSATADYLIDDQPKHCVAAAEIGIKGLLFGDYAWNRDIKKLPAGVARVKDWQAIEEYFKREKP